jgi:thiol-disulfide isomerase/thioredoxin/outer membrane lipoprotein-sorting protein
LAIASLLIAALLAGGCEPKPSAEVAAALEGDGNSESSANSGDASSAKVLLDEVAARYAEAKFYDDAGELYVEAQAEGRKQAYPPAPYAVAFERPNRVRLQVLSTQLVSDGKNLHGAIATLENQVLALAAPASLELGHFKSDEILRDSLAGGLDDAFLPQLQLLLGAKALPGFGDAAKPTMLGEAKIGDETLKRVAVNGDSGTTTYWIDPATKLIKRIEFPTDKIIEQQGEGVESLKIWADFKNARFDAPIDAKAFQFELPPSAQLVKRFLSPPPVAPPALLGQPIEEFSFDNLQDGTIDNQAVSGKIVVFDFWATWCGWCFRGFPNLQKVYDKFAEEDRIALFAVSTDEANVTDDQVRQSIEQQKLKFPLARDRKQFSESVFDVQGLPTLVVLDGKGVVQYMHIGFDPDLEANLSDVLQRLLDGEDVAAKELEKHQRERQEYEQQLNDALVGSTATYEVPPTEVAERSEPENFELTAAWTNEEIVLPGNLVAVATSDPAKLYVLSGSRNIVELDAEGKQVAEHKLNLPEQVGVSTIRTGVDASGRRYFAVFANTQQQVFLFDEKWEQLWAYPDSKHSGLSDVQFADLAKDGQLKLYVSYWGVVGVQEVTLEGSRSWSNRQLENVTRMAVFQPSLEEQLRLLCVNGRDFVLPIDAAGKALPEFRIEGQSLYAIFADELDGLIPQELCALSTGSIGVFTAVGLSDKGSIQWTYDLPRGVHAQPVEIVQTAILPTANAADAVDADGGRNDGETNSAIDRCQRVWMVAGCDGSIHFLSASGKLVDKFNSGEELTGLASLVVGEQPMLVVATGKKVSAFRVTEKK